MEEEPADIGDSATYPIQCSALRKNGFVMMNGRPCKIEEWSGVHTGKHGNDKVYIIGVDLFSGKRYDDMFSSTQKMEVPIMKHEDYQLTDISDDGFLSLMTEDCDLREDIKLPAGELGEQLRTEFDNGKELLCTVLKCCGEEGVVMIKTTASGQDETVASQ